MRQNVPSKWLRPLAIGLLLWNLLGAYACLQQLRSTAGVESLADPYQQTLYSSLPPIYGWLFVGAEVTGVLGAGSLVAMKRIAQPLFIASLTFIALQFGYLFTTTNLLSHEGLRATLFPLLVFSIGVTQVCVAARV